MLKLSQVWRQLFMLFFFSFPISHGKITLNTHLHFVLRFCWWKIETNLSLWINWREITTKWLTWNQVLTWASVIFNPLANWARSADARYFCLWNRFSSSATWTLVNDVLGFFRFGGVLFWYGWPILRVMGKPGKWFFFVIWIIEMFQS